MQVTDLQELEKRIYAALAAIKPDGQHFAASVSLGCMAQLLTSKPWLHGTAADHLCLAHQSGQCSVRAPQTKLNPCLHL